MSHLMTTTEREAFLADVHVGVLGVRTESSVLAVPVWYDYEPGGDITLITAADSIKGRALSTTKQFSMCAQIETPPYKYVTVEGTVTNIEPCSVETVRSMAHRYLGPELGDAYVEGSGQPGSLFHLRPERWYTVDYSKDFG